MPDTNASTPPPPPEESGVIPEQHAASPAALAALTPIAKGGIGGSELVAAIREAGSAFTANAPQVILARFAEDYHRRLDERDKDVRELREALSQCREDRARLEEREAVKQGVNSAQDMLKIAGGAVMGVGLTEAVSGKPLLGVMGALVGIFLVYAGGARMPSLRRIPRLRRHG